jgi:hypothetical protein
MMRVFARADASTTPRGRVRGRRVALAHKNEISAGARRGQREIAIVGSARSHQPRHLFP